MCWATCSVPEVRTSHAGASAALQDLTDQEQIKHFTSSEKPAATLLCQLAGGRIQQSCRRYRHSSKRMAFGGWS